MKFLTKLKNKFIPRKRYPSETSKVRHLVIDYCNGYGCDIGFGGDKIKKEDCVGIDFKTPYAYVGEEKVDVICDLTSESIPIDDNTFDYVYSSHLIEDFEDTFSVLKEFIRILKSNGNLILVFPNQKVYETYCRMNNQPLNHSHVHKNMGLSFMLDVIKQFGSIDYKIIFHSNCWIDYNVILVLNIVKKY